MTTPRQAMHRALVVGALVLLIGACAGGDEVGIGAAKPTPSPAASAEDPDVTGGVGGSSTPTPGPSPTGSAQPAPGPAAVGIAITPIQITLWLPAGAGSDEVAGFSTSAQLSAVVTHTDGSKSSQVTWQSLSPAIAQVSETGLVTTLAAGSGAGPWVVAIRATSLDLKATATRNVTVNSDGRLKVEVD